MMVPMVPSSARITSAGLPGTFPARS
jgi:hypothetical protein